MITYTILNIIHEKRNILKTYVKKLNTQQTLLIYISYKILNYHMICIRNAS